MFNSFVTRAMRHRTTVNERYVKKGEGRGRLEGGRRISRREKGGERRKDQSEG